jgi:hypothetical protein
MTADERRLLGLFRALNAPRQAGLLDYADYLSLRAAPEAELIPQVPQAIERPAQESVVKAIKRLRETYPMLDRAKLINETSALMSQHLLQGRAAVEVINDLEALFLRHYQVMQTQTKESK